MKFSKIKIKTVVLSVIILTLFGMILYNLPFQKTLDMTIAGVECKAGEEGFTESEIHIKGAYYFYLFKKNTFRGIITVKGYDYKFDEALTRKYFNITLPDRWTTVDYYSSDPTYFYKTESMGRIFITNNFEKIMILPYDKSLPDSGYYSWGGQGTKFICFPAATRAEATEIAENFGKIWSGSKHTDMLGFNADLQSQTKQGSDNRRNLYAKSQQMEFKMVCAYNNPVVK